MELEHVISADGQRNELRAGTVRRSGYGYGTSPRESRREHFEIEIGLQLPMLSHLFGSPDTELINVVARA
jgi:hypothetical protein